MKTDSLVKFFRDELSIKDLVSEITPEVQEHLKLLKKGASAPVDVSEGEPFTVTAENILKLISLFKSQSLDEEYLNYIGDVMFFSENIDFENEDISEVVFFISNPDVNGRLDAKFLDQIDKLLKKPNS